MIQGRVIVQFSYKSNSNRFPIHDISPCIFTCDFSPRASESFRFTVCQEIKWLLSLWYFLSTCSEVLLILRIIFSPATFLHSPEPFNSYARRKQEFGGFHLCVWTYFSFHRQNEKKSIFSAFHTLIRRGMRKFWEIYITDDYVFAHLFC